MSYSGKDIVVARSTDGGTTYVPFMALTSVNVDRSATYSETTNNDSDAWRKQHPTPMLRTVSITGAGVVEDDVLVQAIMAGTSSFNLEDIKITHSSGATDVGNFTLNAVGEAYETQSHVTQEFTLESAGEVTYTPAP